MNIAKLIGILFLALLAFVCLPLLMWIAVFIGLSQVFKEWRTTRPQLLSGNLFCSTDTDCPPGYICISGKCAPKLST